MACLFLFPSGPGVRPLISPRFVLPYRSLCDPNEAADNSSKQQSRAAVAVVSATATGRPSTTATRPSTIDHRERPGTARKKLRRAEEIGRALRQPQRLATLDHPATSLGARCAIATSTATIRVSVDHPTIANVSGSAERDREPSHQGSRPDANYTIGLDIAKNVFQVHGIDARKRVVVRKQLRRCQLMKFFEALPPCLIGLEACASTHHWDRELAKQGHEVRLMPAKDMKAYVKRNKNDAANAEAISEAVRQPTMRFCAGQVDGTVDAAPHAPFADAATDPSDKCATFAGEILHTVKPDSPRCENVLKPLEFL